MRDLQHVEGRNEMKKFIGLLAVIVILTACNNTVKETTASKESKELTENSNSVQENTDTNQSINDNGDQTNANTNEITDSQSESDQSDENSASEIDQTIKDEYQNKLSDTKKAIDELKLADNTTVSYKKFETDRWELWDQLLNDIYGTLKNELTEDEFEKLRAEQREWIKTRDQQAKEASLEFEGGTWENVEYTSVLANVTEERCYELVEKYLK